VFSFGYKLNLYSVINFSLEIELIICKTKFSILKSVSGFELFTSENGILSAYRNLVSLIKPHS
jgi:hypothetical protein